VRLFYRLSCRDIVLEAASEIVLEAASEIVLNGCQ
jgi:hypothetical protein